ncbi:MAG: DUF4176 domain-containing protein [Butyrivibrio sp.]|nr:DUF4176 domain-containing protein [Butyrivibrio sp.]
MEIKNILPVGTVVLLKEHDIKVMICGYCQTSDDWDYAMDYSGLPFPVGYYGEDKIIPFNEDQIDRIVAMGLEDDEEQEFVDKLKKVIKDIPERS